MGPLKLKVIRNRRLNKKSGLVITMASGSAVRRAISLKLQRAAPYGHD